jgi:long-chain acyl-CoA synthetase
VKSISEKPWLAKYPEEIPSTIEYEECPLGDFLKKAVSSYPEKKALHFLGKELTYSELYDEVLQFSDQLQQLGLKKGDRVSIMLPNCPQAVISYYAVLMLGGIVVQTNPMYTERELQYQLNDSNSTFIVCLDLLYPKVAKVRGSTPLEHVIVTSIKDYLPFPKNLIYPFIQKKQHNLVVTIIPNESTHKFKELVSRGECHVPKVDINPKEDLALLQYTGGTTGQAKGVMLTHYNLVANTLMIKSWTYKCKEGEERILGILPFFHVFGMTCVMNLSILLASEMILLPKFDAEDTLKTIHKQKPTLFPGAPTVYIALLNHPTLSSYDLSSIEACISGSAPLPTEVQEQFETITGGKLVEGYGLTETSPVATSNLIWGDRVKGSVGIPWPDTEVCALSVETGEPAPANEIGEIAIKGPQVMRGYWNRPEETSATFKDGWLLTGDLGYMNEEGYFFIVDRKKDMIIAGGFNIYPREIEEVLYEHDSIQEAVVVGVPDSYRGETVKAFIVVKQGKTLTEDEVESFCRKHMAAYKVPREYEFRAELPKTTVGKILRRKLVEEEKEKMNQIG